MKKIIVTLSMIGIIASVNRARAQGHYHLYIGATGTNQNDQLSFDDQNQIAPNFNFVASLIFTNAGTYAGYFQPGGITTAVLARTVVNGGVVPNAPALGSRIFIQLVSVQGPAGGAFNFWDTNTIVPSFSLASGTTNGTNAYCASMNDGSPGSDPYGHVHGRAFTATTPGIYTLGLRAFDASTNGVGGGPIHTPSDIFYLQFQAGVNIASLVVSGDTATPTFGATGGKNFIVEYNDDLRSTNWQAVGDVVSGDDHWHSVSDSFATNSARFYRVKRILP